MFQNNDQMLMRPIKLSHEKPLTDVKYNSDGDLLFTSYKMQKPSINVWWADNGERIGTYDGHQGAVFTLDVDHTSTRLLSGAADSSVKLWDVESGAELYSWKFNTPTIRSVAFDQGNHRFLAVTDALLKFEQEINIFALTEDYRDQDKERKARFVHVVSAQTKVTRAVWGHHNESIITASVDGTLKILHAERSRNSESYQIHKGEIRSLQYDKFRSVIVTASKDGYAKLVDVRTMKIVKEYDSGRPLNAASLSPLMDHIILGGGEEASNVTLTGADSRQFDIRFFHSIFCDELGTIGGHFGPINCLTFSPDGRSFASGSEDGFVRLHYFDDLYFNRKDEISQI